MSRQIAGEFENRIEYHASLHEQTALTEQALESVEDLLLTERSTSSTGLWCTYEDDVMTRNMKLSHTNTRVEDENIFVGDDGTIVVRQIQPRAVSVDITVQSQRFRKGALRESTEVHVQESVYGFKTLMMTRYIIEQFVGDTMRAYVDVPDLTRESGHEIREMVPYDFHLFQKQMNVIVALRKGILAGHYGSETEVNS